MSYDGKDRVVGFRVELKTELSLTQAELIKLDLPPISSSPLSLGFRGDTSKLAGTTEPLCLLSFRSQLCLVLLRCSTAAVTPISALNQYAEVPTPPCLDSQAGSPDSRTALRRSYHHKPPYRNAAEATDPTETNSAGEPGRSEVMVSPSLRAVCLGQVHRGGADMELNL
ncbi:unnamed protein product [Pleuronectes platessa]|uniref:Uncharacterized protein n=1 Tax=Pleuronectes platessa TaxID=8262 RepID=A0A9N7VAD6_PLEPL|nr:unnamed protein product [Pleuronectes platessa]